MPVSFGIRHAKYWLIGIGASFQDREQCCLDCDDGDGLVRLRSAWRRRRIRIGARVNLRDGTIVHSCWGRGAIIGDDVAIGYKALIHACTLESGSFVGGVSVVVTDHVIVLSGAMVAARRC